jgi:hypothetical protein
MAGELSNPYSGIRLWVHQRAMLSAPWAYPNREYFFLVAGYGSGKSFTIACMMLRLAYEFRGKSVVIGVGADTITRLRKTVLAELFKLCVTYGTKYSYDGGQNTLSIGRVKFMMVNTSLPEEIYGYSYSAFLCDELDELQQDKALEAFRAIQERTRVIFPDGRIPWSAFFSTAQGYRATYQIVSEMEQNDTPAVVLHGRTADNESLPESYVQRLYRIYDEIERLVFLEGQFANLTTGRVYYEYDEAKHRLATMSFELQPENVVHIGQDLNTGYSRGCAIVKRDKVLYVVKRWSFVEIGRAPSIIRRDFPRQVDIRWYPDASGKEIIAGYASEIRAEGIRCRIGTVNPSVLDRIFFVNKLFALGRLKLFNTPDTAPLSMALKVRQYDENGDPEKGKGPEAPVHDVDGLEYAVWRIVCSDPDFKDLWQVSRTARQVSIGKKLE